MTFRSWRPALALLLVGFPLWMACGQESGGAPAQAQAKGAPTWEVYFSPKGGCTEAVVKALGKAKTSVLVQAYSFTSAPIAKALVEAARRGVKVDVLLDKSQRTEKYSSADFVAHEGIPTKIDAVHAIAHNKVMVIDGTTDRAHRDGLKSSSWSTARTGTTRATPSGLSSDRFIP